MFSEEVATEVAPDAETTQTTETTESAPSDDWKSALPENLRSDPSIEPIKTVEDLAKRTIESQKMVGSNVYLPSDKDSDEVWSDFYSKIGKPKEARDYQLKSRVLDGNESPIVPDELLQSFQQHAHENNLTTKQANATLGFYEKVAETVQKESDEFVQKVKEKATEELKSEFGDAFDQKIEIARQVMRELGGEQLMKDAESTGFGMNTGFVKLLTKVGSMIGEDRILGQNKVDVKLAPRAAEMQIEQMRSNPETMKIRQDPTHPRYEEVTSKFNQLHKEAYGSNPI